MRGRSRQIKPELFADEQLGDLERESGLPIFRAFVGLLVFADREGRFRWAPRALRGAIAPCWDGDFDACLEALASRSFIIRYRVNGEDFGFVRSFTKHQTVHPKEAPSVLPPPEAHGSVEFPGIPGNEVHASRSPAGELGSLLGTLEEAHAQACEVEVGSGSDARGGATTLHTEPPSVPGLRVVGTSGVSRTVTMPGASPPTEYFDLATMGGVSREQAASTWKHYWGAGLPERGVEKLYPWLVQRALERRNATTKASGKHKSAQQNLGKTGFESVEEDQK